MRHKLIKTCRPRGYTKSASANVYGLDVTTLKDPTDTYPRGGRFSVKNFTYTARLRYWPVGAEFAVDYKVRNTVQKHRRVRILPGGDVQDMDTGETMGFAGNYAMRWPSDATE